MKLKIQIYRYFFFTSKNSCKHDNLYLVKSISSHKFVFTKECITIAMQSLPGVAVEGERTQHENSFIHFLS